MITSVLGSAGLLGVERIQIKINAMVFVYIFSIMQFNNLYNIDGIITEL